MKVLILISFWLGLLGNVSAQGGDPWFSFYNADETLAGFKDAKGVIKIPPKFQTFSLQSKFNNVIGVVEVVGEKSQNYYLTRSGRKLAIDSVYYWDFQADAEQEGFIRFRDYKKDKIGLLNINGDVIIPASFDVLSKVHNGMIYALSGAKRTDSEDECHYNFEGGNRSLIDTNNQVLIDTFEADGRINFYSVKISDMPDPSPIRDNFRAKKGGYYSFINYEKEFRLWLQTAFLNNFTKENLLNASFSRLKQKNNGGQLLPMEPKAALIERNFELIKSKLLQLNDPDCDLFVGVSGLDYYENDSPEFSEYFDDAHESKAAQFPVLSVVIRYNIKNPPSSQDVFEFLRTEQGYKLIEINIQNR